MSRRIPPGAGQQTIAGLPTPPPPPDPPRPRMDDYQAWTAKAYPVYLEAAASGRRFTSFEAADEAKLPDPPNPQAEIGPFIGHLRHEGLIEHVGWDSSSRAESGKSGVKVWRGTRKAKRMWADLCAARAADTAREADAA